jgi:hypothetical protein
MNANASYKQRNATFNIGKTRFEEYCQKKNLYFRRLGFDSVEDPIPNFFNLNSFIRNLPDYFICKSNTDDNQPTALIMVKGTPNITRKEYDLIPQLIKSYASPRCPLLYAFAFENMTYFKKADEIIKLYKASTDQTWPRNNTIHRTLRIPHPDGGYWGNK